MNVPLSIRVVLVAAGLLTGYFSQKASAQSVRYEALTTFDAGPRFADPNSYYYSADYGREAAPILGNDGNYYGTSCLGGIFGRGTIFRVTPAGELTVLWNFGEALGAPSNPSGGLTMGADGAFYGVTQTVVGRDTYERTGTAFRFVPGEGLTVLARFGSGNGEVPGRSPQASLTLGPDNYLYGTTRDGGSNGLGTLFRISPDGVVTSLFSFTGRKGFRGNSPTTAVAVAADGTVYGTASNGYSPRYGGYYTNLDLLLWSYVPATNTYKTLRVITHPRVRYAYGLQSGDLSFGPDGALYCSVQYDTQKETATLFRFERTGRFRRVAKLGSYTSSSLTLGPDGRFYGSRPSASELFAVSTTGVVETIASLPSTSGSSQNPAPHGAPRVRPDGSMIGITTYGGELGMGAIYRRAPDGTLSTLTSLPRVGASNAAYAPTPELTFEPDGSLIYLRRIRDRDYSQSVETMRRSPDGQSERLGKLVYGQAPANLYFFPYPSPNPSGLTRTSGGRYYGCIHTYVYSLDDTGTVMKVAYFGSNLGSYPHGAPVQGTDGALYGVTRRNEPDGGGLKYGGVYRLTTDGTSSSLVAFTGKTGSAPGASALGPLLDAGNDVFYGVTSSGGAADLGTVFKVTKAGVFTSLAQFTGTTGSTPGSRPQPLSKGPDGNFYGVANTGGMGEEGVLFRISAAGGYEVLAQFGAQDVPGKNPAGRVAITPDLVVYGVTQAGGSAGYGIAYRWTAAGGIEELFSFTGPGDREFSGRLANGLTVGPDGDLYGTTGAGGPGDAGTIYRLRFGPVPTTLAATDLMLTTATLNGTIDPNGVAVDVAFEYGETTGFGQVVNIGSFAEDAPEAPVQASLSGLAQGTTYYFRLRATATGDGTVQYGPTLSFTTVAPGAPVVTTGSVSSVTLSGGILSGTVNPRGDATTGYFEYGTDTNYGQTGAVVLVPNNGLQPLPVQFTVDGFGPGVTVHYRLVATNNFGTVYGTDATFVTGAIPPVVATGSASGIDGTSATLGGTVNPNNTATTAVFDYGTTNAYGQSTPATTQPGAGGSAVPVSTQISGLLPKTTYHFRLRATNAGGETVGGDATFETLAAAPTVTLKTPYGLGANAATLAGTVNPNGSVTTAEFRYGLTPSLGTTIASTPQPGNGRSAVNVQAALTGLAPNSHYYFKLIAVSEGGTTESAQGEFFTTLEGSSGSGGTLAVQNDRYFVGADEIDLPVLNNDATPNLVPDLRIQSYTNNGRGFVSVNDSDTQLSYAPANAIPREDPRDTFTYIARDPGGNTGTATVDVYYWLGLADTYEGSLRSSNDQGSGSMTATINSAGSLTATVTWRGGRYSFKKSFNLYGRLDKQLITYDDAGVLRFALDFDPDTRRIIGTLSDDSTSPPLVAAVALNGPPVGVAVTITNSVFTTFIAESGPSSAAPEGPSAGLPDLRLRGFGFARVNVGRNGDGRFIGRMPDLAPFTDGRKLLRDALTQQLKYSFQPNVYATRAFSRPGRVGGDVEVGGVQAFQSLLATLDWDRPPAARPGTKTYFPNGFTTRARLTGKPITVRKQAVPDGFSSTISPNAQLTLSSGGLTSTIRRDIDVTTTGARVVSSVNPEKVSVRLNSATAFISGSFIHPATSTKVSFFGARAGAGESSRGTFLAPDPNDGAGSVEIVPEDP